MFLTNAQLARFRADVLKMLPDTAVIEAYTRASDGAGGWSETWAPVTGGTVAARLDPLTTRNSQAIESGQEVLVSQRQLTLPYDAPIDDESRVVIHGETYDVVTLDEDHSWRVSRRAVVTKRD